jgi:peptidoglycan glycosyltransferase
MNDLWGRTSLLASFALLAGLLSLGVAKCDPFDGSSSLNRAPAGNFADAGLPLSVLSKEDIALSVGPEIALNRYPEHAKFEVGAVPVVGKIEYGFETDAQDYIEKVLSQYRPDYGVFVAMDAKTGRIIALASRSQNPLAKSENLALRATFPAASIFKVVTAGAVLDTEKVGPDTRIAYNGANHTLYRRNVVDNKENRWTRRITIREAFGSSVNTVFGKLGLFYAGPETLRTYAERFHFNLPIRADIPIQTGYSRFTADDPWSVVAAASGFTQDNTMSPVQGAMIASAVANDGVMMEPYVVESVVDQAGQALYRANPRRTAVVVGPETARQLRQLFEQTVLSGTSRKSFRAAVRKRRFENVEFGGKTGSLTGLNPRGKCDWFVGYALFGENRIAVAALTVNEEKWRVKSSTLAQMFLTQYIRYHENADR